MSKLKFPTDRQINSTENNGYAEGVRDENLWEKDLIDTEIPEADILPIKTNETGVEKRPVYNEQGYKYQIGDN